MTPKLTTRHVLGAPICAATMHQALELAEAHIASRRRLLIGVVNAAKLVNMRRDAALRESVLSSDVIFADGMAVVWASRLLGRPLPERVAGIDLMMELLHRGSERRWRIYCLGATQEVLDGVTREIRARFPGVQLAGAQHGYFTAEQEPAVADAIARSRPDILFVAMTSPKKEQFLARWMAQIGAPVCHGVGGSFDVLAGKVQRAPRLWQALGLEWAYRVAQEPGRLWKRYLITNVTFVWMLLGAAVARVFGRLAADDPRPPSNASRPGASSRPV